MIRGSLVGRGTGVDVRLGSGDGGGRKVGVADAMSAMRLPAADWRGTNVLDDVDCSNSRRLSTATARWASPGSRLL